MKAEVHSIASASKRLIGLTEGSAFSAVPPRRCPELPHNPPAARKEPGGRASAGLYPNLGFVRALGSLNRAEAFGSQGYTGLTGLGGLVCSQGAVGGAEAQGESQGLLALFNTGAAVVVEDADVLQ